MYQNCCKKCGSSSLHTTKIYTKDEVIKAIDNLKDYDNYKPFHMAVDRIIEMFENMK